MGSEPRRRFSSPADVTHSGPEYVAPGVGERRRAGPTRRLTSSCCSTPALGQPEIAEEQEQNKTDGRDKKTANSHAMAVVGTTVSGDDPEQHDAQADSTMAHTPSSQVHSGRTEKETARDNPHDP